MCCSLNTKLRHPIARHVIAIRHTLKSGPQPDSQVQERPFRFVSFGKFVMLSSLPFRISLLFIVVTFTAALGTGLLVVALTGNVSPP